MRILTSVEQITALPTTAVIITPQQYVLERLAEGWFRPGLDTAYTKPNGYWVPAVLVREREADVYWGQARD